MPNLVLLVFLLCASPSAAIDFLFNSFSPNDLIFRGDASVVSSVIRLTNDADRSSMGQAFYPNPIEKRTSNNTIASFSTSFVFSILPEGKTSPAFGLAFVITNSTVPPGALSGEYFGLFTDLTTPSAAPLLVVEFDAGRNSEFSDLNNNHVGIGLNSAESVVTMEAGFYNSSNDEFVPIDLRSGSNIQAWIEFDGTRFGLNVTIAPVGISRPPKPLISFHNPVIAHYAAANMFVGFSASHANWSEAQRVLAWSLTDGGAPRDINTSSLPNFSHESSSDKRGLGPIVGIVFVSSTVLLLPIAGFYCFRLMKRRSKEEEEEVQSWEIDYWPHRFSYVELARATKEFSDDQLLGSGGFGRVFKGIQANNNLIAVKSISRNSNQGLREFMAEISTIGRLQHKNLVPLRGWCKKGQEMLLVYDYMPNGSLYSWIFSKSRTLNWNGRLLVLMDIAEGLNYLHTGWLHLVLHRDIKSSNILLDSDMCGRLGDFGLAKLYKHGQAPMMTRLVGTVGYMAPELVKAGPTKASDIYSFGVVVLEVVCGRRPTELQSEDELALVDWVRKLNKDGRLSEAADFRIAGEYKVDDVEIILRLGLACCDVVPEVRPNMKEIVASLMSLKSPAPLPNNLSSEFQGTNYNDLGNTSEVSKLSVITDPAPRT